MTDFDRDARDALRIAHAYLVLVTVALTVGAALLITRCAS